MMKFDTILDLLETFKEYPEIRDDFIKFSNEIDRVIEETGLSEEQAEDFVSAYWNFDFINKERV